MQIRHRLVNESKVQVRLNIVLRHHIFSCPFPPLLHREKSHSEHKTEEEKIVNDTIKL